MQIQLQFLNWIYFVTNTDNQVYVWCYKYAEKFYCQRRANK